MIKRLEAIEIQEEVGSQYLFVSLNSINSTFYSNYYEILRF